MFLSVFSLCKFAHFHKSTRVALTWVSLGPSSLCIYICVTINTHDFPTKQQSHSKLTLSALSFARINDGDIDPMLYMLYMVLKRVADSIYRVWYIPIQIPKQTPILEWFTLTANFPTKTHPSLATFRAHSTSQFCFHLQRSVHYYLSRHSDLLGLILFCRREQHALYAICLLFMLFVFVFDVEVDMRGWVVFVFNGLRFLS